MFPISVSSRCRLQTSALRRKRGFKSKPKHGKNHGMHDMRKSFKKLKSEMVDISMEQKHIREGQRQVKEKFEAIETECEQLKKETRFIIQQSARTQAKLALMFSILKARETGDLETAATLTNMLREVVGKEKKEKEKF